MMYAVRGGGGGGGRVYLRVRTTYVRQAAFLHDLFLSRALYTSFEFECKICSQLEMRQSFKKSERKIGTLTTVQFISENVIKVTQLRFL